MKSVLTSLTHYFETVPSQLRKRQLIIWIIFILTTVLIGIGITRLKFDMTLEGWFADDDPLKIALDEFHAEFGSDDGVYIVYKPADGNVFSEKSLSIVKGIRDDLLNSRSNKVDGKESMLNHIVRINSLVNAPVLTAEDDSLVSKHLVGATIPTNMEELEEIRQTAATQKDFPLLYFSKDYRYGGIFIETDFGTVPLNQPQTFESSGFDQGFGDTPVVDDMVMSVDKKAVSELVKFKATEMDEYLGLMEEINKVLKKPEYAGHMKYYPVGNAPMMEYGMEVMAEMGPMYLGMLLIMIVLLWFLFRSLSAVVWPISIVVFCTLWTVGIVAWMGITITTMLMLTVMLILAVGTADAIHILSGYLYFRKQNQDHQTAMAHAFQKSALACLLTSITTMIGMFSLTFTPIIHIKTFGFMSAFGVGLAFLFTIYLLPLMLDLWSPVPVTKKSRDGKGLSKLGSYIPDFSFYLQKFLDTIIPTVEKHRYKLTFLFIGIFGICLYGATVVKVDSNMIEQFKEGTSIREVYEIVDRYMMGTQNLEILLDLGKEDAFQDPKVLKAVDELQETIARKYDHIVVKTSSLANVVKDAYQTLNEDRPEMYKIPDDSRMLSQTLFLFNNANPEDRRKLVTDNYRKSHISVQMYNEGSYEYIRIFDQMRQDIENTVNQLKPDYPDLQMTITGGLALIMEFSDYITWSQIKSLGLAIGVISIVLIFVFGSFRAGLISIIPNLLPATITFGMLGLLNIPLDADTMIIAPVIIGIAVDDTIHLITHYRGEVIIDGDVIRALRDTIKEVGQAVTFTTLILSLGFSIMAFSSHMGTSNMGRFGTLAIFVALLCDLFMLPAMIMIFKPKFAKHAKLQPVANPNSNG